MSEFFKKARENAYTFQQHADYQVNIQLAWRMHNKWFQSDNASIWTMIRDSEHYKKCLFTFGFTPDKRAKMGKYSRDVWLHQSKESFMKECESVRKATLGLFQTYSERFKEKISEWKKMDEKYWQDFLRKNPAQDVEKLLKDLSLSFKVAQPQGIKC